MKHVTTAQAPNADVLAEAARWFVLLMSGEATTEDRQRWQAWRAADALHEAGWQRAEAATALFGGLPREQAPATLKVLERGPRVSRGRRRALGGLAGLFVAGFMGWQGWRHSDGSADQVTVVGEQRSITLPDGSLLRMDTDTAVDIVFSAQSRLVRLRRGRVLIATAKSAQPLPPFWVQTDQSRVQALGTRFAVVQEGSATEVAVLEARVAIHPAQTRQAPPVVIPAGQAVRIAKDGLLTQRTVRPGEAAWVQGVLIADNIALDAFVAELARYRRAPLVCDPAVRHLRISGTYPLADTDRVLAVLPVTLPVRVTPRHARDPARGFVVAPAS